VWLQFAEGAGFERWRPFVEAFDTDLGRLPILVVVAQSDLETARRIFPNYLSMAAPVDEQQAMRSAFKTVRPGDAVYLGNRAGAPRWLALLCQRRGKEFFVVEEEYAGTSRIDGEIPIGNSYRLSRLDPTVEGHAGSGSEDPSIRTFSPAPTTADVAAREVAAAILERRRNLAKARKSATSNPRKGPLGFRVKFCIGQFHSRRIASLDALNERLGRPDTIACLGSGPSAEHPQLLDLHFDRLFRVNLRWLDRDFLDDPDVIFTWRSDVGRVKRRAILGFRDVATERQSIVNRFPRQVLGPRLEYFTIIRLPLLLNDWLGDFTPTTGALMLDVAAALRPKRLIIAGFDLFLHPEGAYPGDTVTKNAYNPFHVRQDDVSFIARVLQDFEGDIVIVGDILREHLAAKGITP